MSDMPAQNATDVQGSAWRIEALHLLPLWGFAVAQPLFNVLSASPEFFVAHRFTVTGLVILAIVVSLGIPLVLAILAALTGQVSEPLRRWCHRIAVAAFAGLTVLGALNLFLDATLIVNGVLAAAVGLGIAALYVRKEGVRRFFTILSPAALLFPLTFLFFSPVSELVFAEPDDVETATVESQTPVVFVIFDEFNPTPLLNADRRIDEVRFSNFAALADTSHWYPNAIGIHKRTLAALPSILGGKIPGNELPPPTYSVYPQTLFTWLGGSYRLNVWETVTNLCPPDLCDNASTVGGFDLSIFISDLALVYAYILVPPQQREQWLPPLNTGWKGFANRPGESPDNEQVDLTAQKILEENFADASAGRAELFKNFISSIEGGTASLDFLHTLLPHGPYEYLSDGSAYTAAIEGRTRGAWTDNEYVVAVAYQRYLHQLGYVDALVGQLVARLKAVGKYDESMIILTSDHGISFNPGSLPREPIGKNAVAVYNVPLLIKTPGQTQGVVSERFVSNAELLATIADVLGENPPWDIDGQSALATDAAGVIQPRDENQVYDASTFSISEQLDWHIENFGAGISLNRTVLKTAFAGLIGRDITDFDREANTDGVRLSSDAMRYLDSVNRDDSLVPVIFSGALANLEPGSHWVALALNGTVAAVAPTFEKGNEPFHLHAMFQPDAIVDGRNTLQAFLIRGSEEDPVLVPIQVPESEAYRLSRDGGVEVISSSSGARYRIEPGVARGYLDQIIQQRNAVQLRGWAVDTGAGTLPQTVLAQVNGGDLHVAELRLSRPDVAEALNNENYASSGFHILAPGVGDPRELRSIRLFMLSANGYAGEVVLDPANLDALQN